MLSKKEIRELVREFKNGTPFGWKIYLAYIVEIDGKQDIIINYIEEGVSEVLYRGLYDKKINIREELKNYKGINGSKTLDETTDAIYKLAQQLSKQ